MKEIKKDLVLRTDSETNEQYWSREEVAVYKAEEHDKLNAVLDILKWWERSVSMKAGDKHLQLVFTSYSIWSAELLFQTLIKIAYLQYFAI